MTLILLHRIDAEVERNVMDARFERPGIACRVDRVGAGQDGRNRRRFGLGVGLIGDVASALAGGNQQDGRNSGKDTHHRQGNSREFYSDWVT